MRKTLKGFALGLIAGIVIMIPVLTCGEAASKIDVIFDRIKLVVNDKPVNSQTILYNGSTYVPIRAISENLGASVDYDINTKTASITMPVSDGSEEPKSSREEAIPDVHINSWYDGRFILETTKDTNPGDPITLVISNASDISMDFRLLKADGSAAAEGTASIKDSEAAFVVPQSGTLTFSIREGVITVTDDKKQIVLSGSASYKKEGTSDNGFVATFAEGNYSSGSSTSARSLVISNLTAVSFDYQIIASDGKRIITKGKAKILSDGTAECVFDDEYKITFTLNKDNVVTAEESKQKLLENGKITFYTA